MDITGTETGQNPVAQGVFFRGGLPEENRPRRALFPGQPLVKPRRCVVYYTVITIM